MVGVTGDITETRQRERQLDMAKAEAAAAHRDVEQAREMMQTVLDNMTDGVTLFDKDFRWRFSNRPHIERLRNTRPASLTPGVPGRRHRALPGRARRLRPMSRTSKPWSTKPRAHPPAGRQPLRAPHRRTDGSSSSPSSRSSDGGLLGIYRDITELKEREEALAAAKEAAEAARDAAERARAEATAARNEVERTREIMQTVLDNMSDGVMLFDKEMRWQFTNRQLMEFQRFTRRRRQPGHFGLRHSATSRRNAATSVRSPESEIKAEVERRVAIMRAGARYERRTASGKFIEFNFKPLEDGGLLAIYRDITELKQREEALAAAKEAGRDRARRSRSLALDAVRSRSELQKILENMTDGVGADQPRSASIEFINDRLMEFHDISGGRRPSRRLRCATSRASRPSAAISRPTTIHEAMLPNTR